MAQISVLYQIDLPILILILLLILIILILVIKHGNYKGDLLNLKKEIKKIVAKEREE